jgi:hypothetical protein
LQRKVDALPADMAVNEGTDLAFGQPFRVRVEGFADAPGSGVDGSGVEEEACTGLAVIPDGHCGVEMGGFDEGAAIEGSVDGAEAENLRFGTAGGGAVHVRTALAHGGIAILPQLARGWGAVEEDSGLALRPFEGAAQLAGQGGKLVRGEGATLGQGLAAAHAGPETAVGKAIVHFGATEVVGELACGDMSDEPEVGAGGVEEMASVLNGKVAAAIPRAAEQRGELAGVLAEHMEHGGELLSEEEEAAVGGGLLIAQSMNDGVGCGAGGGYAARNPIRVGLVEEASDLTPAGSFAGLAGFAHQYDEEVEAVTSGADRAMRRGADQVAEGGQELQEDGSGIGFRVRRKAADSEAGETVKG